MLFSCLDENFNFVDSLFLLLLENGVASNDPLTQE
jgi:hypothetical protein